MKTKKILFAVTLPWNDNDPEEGTYTEKVWASDRKAAIRMVAIEMADEQDCGEWPAKYRREKINIFVAGATSESVVDVKAQIISDLYDIMSGPKKHLTKEASHARATILDIISLFEDKA